MLRTSSCIIALNAMVAVLSTTVQAADESLTLACKGTATWTSMEEDAKSEPVSMGIILNFTKKTVHGFGTPGLMDYPVNITGVDEASVAFGGYREYGATTLSITGSVDRVTGDVGATSTMFTNTKKQATFSSTTYSLKCRPAQRMF
jgi:hypothetical protein